jgi:hypothetical protein
VEVATPRWSAGKSLAPLRATADEERDRRQRLYIIIRRSEEEEACTLRRIESHIRHAFLLSHPTFKKYVRRDGRKKDAEGRPAGALRLDRKAIEHMRVLAGKSVIATDDLEANPVSVDGIYRNLFDVEALFRRMKTTLRVGPIRHRRDDRIRAHVMIAVMAANVGRWLERRGALLGTNRARRRPAGALREARLRIAPEALHGDGEAGQHQMRVCRYRLSDHTHPGLTSTNRTYGR